MPPEIQELRDGRGDSRNRARGRGAFIDYYEDLGLSTTEEGYAGWRANEDQYQSDRAENLASIKEAQGQYDTAKADHDSALSRGWAETQSGFTNVRLVTKDNQIIGNYRLPKNTTDELNAKLGNDANYVDDGRNFNIVETGGVAGSLDSLSSQMYNQYVSASAPAMAESAGVLAGYQGQIDNANKQIAGIDTERARQMTELQDNYAKKLETLREIFGGSE